MRLSEVQVSRFGGFRRRSSALLGAGVLAVLSTVAAITVSATASPARAQAVAASGDGCGAGPVPVFSDSFAPGWYNSSWSGTQLDTSSGAAEVVFPLGWSALSMSSDPVSIVGCTHLSFSVATSVDNPTLKARVNYADGTRSTLEFTDATVAGTRLELDLGSDAVSAGQAIRVSFINKGQPGMSAVFDDISFVDPEDDGTPGGETTLCAPVFDDALVSPWYPSSWTVADQVTSGTFSATFPRRWGALSTSSSSAVDVSACTSLQFTASADRSAAIQVRLVGADGSTVDYPNATETFSVGVVAAPISVSLASGVPANGSIRRIVFLNKSGVEGVRLSLDNIRFVGGGGSGGGGGSDPTGLGMNWGDDPGVPGTIDASLSGQEFWVSAEPGVAPNDGVDDSTGFRAALAKAAAAGGGIVRVPAGEWHVSETLQLRDRVVISGAGSNQTTITFRNRADGTFGGSTQARAGIALGFSQGSGSQVSILSGEVGSTRLRVATTSAFTAGDYAVIDNPSGSFDSTAGQMVKIVDVAQEANATVVTLERPAGLDYDAAFTLATIPLSEGAGVQNVRLRTTDSAALVSQMVNLNQTADAFVRNVVSELPRFQHVAVSRSYRCEVTGSFFDNAHTHGDGGRGYGVNLANSTSNCLVSDNSFRRLRHSMLLHVGATANVLAFNHSREPFHPNYPNGGPTDISFHGFAAANLVENNVVERIMISDADLAGPHNAIFRNCLTAAPLTLANRAYDEFVIGNAMYGTDRDLLLADRMPGFNDLDGTTAPKPYNVYNTPNLFGTDGVLDLIGPDAGNEVFANWHAGSGATAPADFAQLPQSYFGASNGVLQNRSGSVNTDCTIPASSRLGPIREATPY